MHTHILSCTKINLTWESTTGKENLTSLAVEAAQKALEMAEVNADDVDLILFCSSSPDQMFGGAPEVRKHINNLFYEYVSQLIFFNIALIFRFKRHLDVKKIHLRLISELRAVDFC